MHDPLSFLCNAIVEELREKGFPQDEVLTALSDVRELRYDALLTCLDDGGSYAECRDVVSEHRAAWSALALRLADGASRVVAA